MKRKIILYTGCGILFLTLLSGCAPYEAYRETIYMQDAKMKVPVLQIPVFLNTGDSTSILEITPRVFVGKNRSFTGKAGQHTLVNSRGIFQVDTIYNGSQFYFQETSGANAYSPRKENYQVTASLFNVGFDANLNVSKSFVLSGGYNFSTIENINLDGFRAGLGFKSYDSPYGIRFDGGLIWQESYYDVSNVIITEAKEWFGSTTRSIAFYHDEGIQKNVSFYMNLNITFYDGFAPLGGFINIGYFKQTMLDIEPQDYDRNYYVDGNPFTFGGTYSSEDLRSSISTSFLNITPGLLLAVLPSAKLIGGVRVIMEVGDLQAAGTFVSPFILAQLVF